MQLARLSKDKRAGAAAAWRMLGLWVFEGLESYVILRLLGAPLGVIEVLSFDAALSVVRSTAMFAPARHRRAGRRLSRDARRPTVCPTRHRSGPRSSC